MYPWSERVVEEANLFNPAFCSMLLVKTAEEYKKKADKPLPYPLIFLVLPIMLHQPTRAALPQSTITALMPWIQENREHLIGFSDRVQRLKPITKEALLFGLQHETLILSSGGDISHGPRRQSPTSSRTPLFTPEARECVDRAGFLGRWFAVSGSTASIFGSWGIMP